MLQREVSCQHPCLALSKVCPCIIVGSLIVLHQLKKMTWMQLLFARNSFCFWSTSEFLLFPLYYICILSLLVCYDHLQLSILFMSAE